VCKTLVFNFYYPLFFCSRVFLQATSLAPQAAQQSVHWTLGILRDFRAFFWLRVFSAPEQNPRPPQRHSPQGKSANANHWALQNKEEEK